MGRHRHALSVREDGLAAVLGALLDDRLVTAAALVDIDSGMVLDACGAGSAESAPPADHDVLGAGHAELMRVALGVLVGEAARLCPADFELVLSCGKGPHHLLQGIPDPFGDRVVLSVVVAGSVRNLNRVRRGLRSVSRSALTAGPTASRRPGEHGWRLGLPERPEPERPEPERRVPDPAARGWAAGPGVLAAPARVDAGGPGPVRPVGPPGRDQPGAATRPPPVRPPAPDYGRPAPPSALPPAPPRA